jgi:beta-lactam-binding protein with PASTA domain
MRQSKLPHPLKVTEQEPAAGLKLERGQSITLFSRKRIPSVLGMEISAAVAKFKDAGINIRLDAATINGDTVFKQVPAPGEWLNGSETASLTSGVMVPDLRGSLKSAKSTLSHLGVVGEVASSRTARSSRPPYPIGEESVFRQSVKPGDWITRTQIVKVNTVRYLKY